MNLYEFFKKEGINMNMKSVCFLALNLLDLLEKLHEMGYIYNDLKLDNICVGFGENIES
jgi:serine/threonine protein kinase